jgi:hypothetical protein
MDKMKIFFFKCTGNSKSLYNTIICQYQFNAFCENNLATEDTEETEKKNLCNLRNLWFLFFIRLWLRLSS